MGTHPLLGKWEYSDNTNRFVFSDRDGVLQLWDIELAYPDDYNPDDYIPDNYNPIPAITGDLIYAIVSVVGVIIVLVYALTL